MQERSVLLLTSAGAEHWGESLRHILASSTNPAIKLTCHTAETFDAGNNDELLKIAVREKPELVLLALSRVQLKTAPALFQLIARAASSSLIVIAADADEGELDELLNQGVADFLLPPFRESEVLVRLRRLLNRVSQEQKTREALTETLGLQQLIGESQAFIAELNKIPVLAKSDTSVLISGETGTGKEMVGRAIHYLGPRANKPFVPVNCGAIPVELLENELFGHSSGAFTGAAGSRDGLIREAEQGTIFLDEVNCLPLLAQVKLLRFLQNKEYRPLGSTKVLTGDVRIIAASNANLEAEVAAGTLRRDLYYRLNVVPIVLPPLRTRSHDIILLARHFLAQYAAKTNSPARAFSAEAERKLLLYSWPGNVRELEHVIERVVVLCTERIIQEEHIILPGRIDLTHLSFQEMKANVISQFESDYLQNVLAACRGNITRAAQVAQKERRTFWALVRKHNIDVDRFRTLDHYEQGNHQSLPG